MKINFSINRIWLHRALLALVLILSLIAILQTFLHVQFSEERLQREIIELIGPTKRDIQFSPGINVKLLPRPTISLNQIRISEPNNPHTALTIKQLEFEFAWFDLLEKNPAPNRLAFDEIDANIIRNENGTLSIDDLLTLRHEENNLPTRLKNLRFINSNFDIQDKSTNSNIRFEQLNFSLKNHYTSNGTFRLQTLVKTKDHEITLKAEANISRVDTTFQLRDMNIDANSRIIPYGEVTLYAIAQVDYQPDQHLFLIKEISSNLDTETPKFNITGKGTDWVVYLNHATLPKLSFTATLEHPQDQQTKLQFEGLMSDVQLKENAITSGPSSLKTNITTNSRTLSIDSLSTVSFDIRTKEYSFNPIQINSHQTLIGSKELTMRSNLIGSFVGVLGEKYTFATTGSLENHDMSFDLNYQKGKLDQYQFNVALEKLDAQPIELIKAENLTTAFFDSERPFDLSSLSNKQIEGTIDIKELSTSIIQLQQVSARIKASPQQIILDQINASIYQGKLMGTTKLSTEEATPTLEIDQRVIGVNIQPLLDDLFGYKKITGRGNGLIQLKAAGRTPKNMRHTLSGDINLNISDGALLGINLVDTFEKSPNKIQEQVNQKLETNPNQKTAFSILKASSHLENGVARNKDLTLNSELLNIKGEGKFNLAEELIDYTMSITANPKLSRFRGVKVPLRITGDITTPVYSLDYAVMTKGKVTKEEKQKALKDELLKQINGIIKQ